MLDGFIAVGSAFAPRVDADPIVLLSLDGATVQEDPTGIGGPGIQTLNDVCVAEDNTTVAVGLAGSTGTHDAIVLHRAPAMAPGRRRRRPTARSGAPATSSPTAARSGPTASSSSARTTPAVTPTPASGRRRTAWSGPRSRPGHWAAAATSGPARRRSCPTATRPTGGSSPAPTRPTATATSPCGGCSPTATWPAANEGERSLAGPGDQTVNGVAVDADGHVTLAGTDYGRVGLWESDRLDR